MATYISLDNLARYDMKAKARAEGLYADASAACWQKTEKAGAVTCVPAPETPLEPVVEFLFKETLPEGTKGPGNPSVIEGVSEIKVTRYGKNLVKSPFYENTVTKYGVTFTVDNEAGTITANGTATQDSTFYFMPSSVVTLLGGRSYFLSGCPSGGSVNTYYMGGARYTLDGNYGARFSSDTGSGTVWTYEENWTPNCTIRIVSGTTVSNLVFKPMLVDGTAALPYEKGDVDVLSIDLGSNFYSGTLDVASGRLTVTHRMVEPSSGTVDISDRPALLPLEYTDTYGRTVTSADGTSLDCGTSGGQIVYKLATPYTIQLDPVMINALPALDKTSPRINTVYTDAENVQVGYAEHPAYTEELINNAILALGGNI